MDLSFIIVFGTRWHFRPTDGGWDGHLNCPVCKQPQRMVQETAFKAFTLYWWPLFKTEDGGQLVRCMACSTRYFLPSELKDGPTTPAPELSPVA